MPELPDLVHVAEVLEQSVVDKTIVSVRVGDPVVLRLMAEVAFPDALCGTALRRLRAGRADACFCPNGQPTDRGLLVDFRRLPTARNRPD